MHRRPLSGILNVAPEFLEAEGSVRPKKEIGAAIVLAIFDAGEDAPGLVNSLGHAPPRSEVNNAAYPFGVRLWNEDAGNTLEVRLCKSLDDAIYSARAATISLRAQRALAIAAE